MSAIAKDVRFNRDVRPILSENCLMCHGPDARKRKAGLRLDQRSSVVSRREKHDSAIVPGQPDASELIRRVSSSDEKQRMPPPESGKQLTKLQIETLREWIAQGAEYENHWAYISPRKIHLPTVSRPGLVRGAIDRFILRRLDAEKLSPNPRATPETLFRRISLDLIGLPPTPGEVERFKSAWLRDTETAWSRVIERLLSSPHFGEKWARWWMDLSHYADTGGYTVDYDRPHAWRWRDWVLDSFNANKPFDQFTIEQIAGDLIPNPTESQKTGTGFFRNTLSNREGGADLEEFRVKKIIDRTATYGATWLGLTIECAQCHDHKFDPITHRDYYSLFAFFNNADEINFDAPLPGEQARWDKALADYRKKWNALVAPFEQGLNPVMRKWEAMMIDAEREPGIDYKRDRALELLGIVFEPGKGEGQLEGVRISRIPYEQRTQRQKERLLDYFLVRGQLGLETEFAALKLSGLKKSLEELGKTLPPVSRPQIMEAAIFPRDTRIFIRGDFRTPGESVEAGSPGFLHTMDRSNSAASRLDLARWTVSKDNPLTARVLVNRIWQEMFGRGLVSTPEDFGVRGNLPTHPELLDWLAVDFMDHGWDLKRLIRMMADSATYRQSSHATREILQRDPQNELLSRFSRTRLSGELVRDAALSASGLLDSRIGGPSVRPPQPESVISEGSYGAKWKTSEGGDRYRRGIYTWIQRVSPYAQFVTFDLPNANRACARRDRSNTPLQALTLLNDPVFVEAAKALANRIVREAPAADDESRIRYGFNICLTRNPTEAELNRLLQFLKRSKRNDSTAVEKSNIASTNSDSLASPFQAPSPPPGERDGLRGQSGSRGQAANQSVDGKKNDTEWGRWVATASVLLNLDEFINRE